MVSYHEHMIRDELQELGLGEREAGVYTLLLELGEVGASELIRRLGWHRQLVYTALERLERDGLVTPTHRGERRRWRAAKPDRIVDRVRDQLSHAEALLPQLRALQGHPGIEQSVEIHPGVDGMKFVREDMLRLATPAHLIYALGAAGKEYQAVLGDYHDQWTKRRIAKQLTYHLLSSPEQRAVMDELFAAYPSYTEVRYLPEGFETPTSTAIYANKVAIQLWGPPEPAVIVIENAALAKNYRDYFDYLWKEAK